MRYQGAKVIVHKIMAETEIPSESRYIRVHISSKLKSFAQVRIRDKKHWLEARITFHPNLFLMPNEVVKGAVLHEVAHLWEFSLTGKLTHGYTFDAYCGKLGGLNKIPFITAFTFSPFRCVCGSCGTMKAKIRFSPSKKSEACVVCGKKAYWVKEV